MRWPACNPSSCKAVARSLGKSAAWFKWEVLFTYEQSKQTRDMNLLVCHTPYLLIYSVHAILLCGGQRRAFGSWFSPSSTWTLGWNLAIRLCSRYLSHTEPHDQPTAQMSTLQSDLSNSVVFSLKFQGHSLKNKNKIKNSISYKEPEGLPSNQNMDNKDKSWRLYTSLFQNILQSYSD